MNNGLTEIRSSLPTCCDEVTQAVVLGGKIDSVQAVVEQGGSTLGRHIREDREKDVRLVIRALLAKRRDIRRAYAGRDKHHGRDRHRSCGV